MEDILEGEGRGLVELKKIDELEAGLLKTVGFVAPVECSRCFMGRAAERSDRICLPMARNMVEV